jgi:GNAT superfamily N-acetyltransferase
MTQAAIQYSPLSIETWEDLVKLFEGHGNPGYCWCTYWRLSSKEYGRSSRTERKQVLHNYVSQGLPTGILGYLDGRVIGWCSVAPRNTYERIERSRTIPRLDGEKIWSIVCFYLDRSVRGRDFSIELLRAAVEYATRLGAEVVEAYPIEPSHDEDGNWQPAKSYRFMGYRSTFERAGFRDITPEGSARLVMRLET